MSNHSSPAFLARPLHFLRKYLFWIALVVLFLWTYGFYTLGASSVYRAYPELHAAAQANQILGKVGKLIVLPAGTPTMVLIKDASSAKKTQPFLVNAKDGDVLIVYAKAGEAILYRPSTGKLVAVGPIKSNPQSTKSRAGGQAPRSSHTEIAPGGTSTGTPTATSTHNATTTKSNK